MTDREDKIRQRAYGIWEEEGYPHGRAQDHWHRAAREVGEEPKVAPSAELTPDIGEAPPLQPADEAPAKKAAPRRRTAANKPAVEPEAAEKTKSRTRAAATRKPSIKKG